MQQTEVAKTCTLCGQRKPLFEFLRSSRNKSGYAARCKVCHRTKYAQPDRVYTDEQRARKREYLKVYVAERAGTAEWQERRRLANEKWQASTDYDKAEKNRQWKQRNPARVLEQTRYRQAKQVNATPPWADRNAIREIYDFAEEFRAAGFDVHVDHIVPLNGKTVSGLHIPANLRVCLAAINQSKGNKVIEWL